MTGDDWREVPPQKPEKWRAEPDHSWRAKRDDEWRPKSDQSWRRT